jgi:hypothetical protein
LPAFARQRRAAARFSPGAILLASAALSYDLPPPCPRSQPARKTGARGDSHLATSKKALGEIALLEIAMSSRRHFLKAGAAAAATGIVFCSCGLSKSAHAQQDSRAKLPVTVNGKRVKTVDVHAHCHFREAGALLGEEGFKLQVSAINGATETYIDLSQRLAAMDAQAVDMEILSINPFWYNRERDVAAQIVKLQNEKLAEFCAANSAAVICRPMPIVPITPAWWDPRAALQMSS